MTLFGKLLVLKGRSLFAPAYVTVLHNGIVVHHHTELLGLIGHRRLSEYRPHPPVGPLRLQVRSIWYRVLKGYDKA